MANNCNKTFRDMIESGQAQILGIVSEVPMGDWSATTTYQKLNYVRHNGATYKAKTSNTNVEPGVATNWEYVWMLCNYDGGLVVPDGTYPDMTAGNATNAQSATKATQDGDGNVITSTYATKAENAAKYTKPSTGIPATDLSSDVQADLAAGATAYQKPSAGIPESDLSSAVQEKLDAVPAVPAPSAANDGNLLSVQDGAYAFVDTADVTVGNATNDGNGDNIADTYLKKEAGVAFAPNALELGNQSGSPNNANIDFHTDGTDADFNSRFVAWGNTNDLEVQVGSGGSFRVPSGQTYLPNGDNSGKAATTEFLQPAVVFAQGDGPQSYGYRGKTYNVSLNTGTFTTSGGGNFIVLRSGNTVVVSGWLQNTVKMPLTANYTLLSNLPQSVGMAYGPVIVNSHIGLGRVWIDFNSKTLNISIAQCLNYADGLPVNSFFAFCVTYITND